MALQGLQVLGKMFPPIDRARMDLLAHLNRACCGAGGYVLLEVQTGLLEIQTKLLKQLSCLTFLISNQ